MKSWLTALFCVIRCILFPQSKICIVSGTRGQANLVLSKIADDFMCNYGWGSENLKREIREVNIGQNKAEIKFNNNSWIRVVTASDTGRGERANIIIVDEFRMVNLKTLNTVVKMFLGAPRQPAFVNLPEYKDKYGNVLEKYLETNIEIYMSSAWYKSHWSYRKFKAFYMNMILGRKGYYTCGLPYQIAVKEGLKKRIEIEDMMSESDFNETDFSMEMGCMPFGASEDAFFKFENIEECRTLKNAVYPISEKFSLKGFKIPGLALNERRILSVDVALMSSTKHKNDASSIIINSAIPKNNNSYTANVIYLDNVEGVTTDELALTIRRLFKIYDCTDLVIDTNGLGLGCFDLLIQDILDPETGELYPALSCCNDKAMADRCKVSNAPKVIWSIKANSVFNSEICVLLRNGLQSKKINLLIPEGEAEEHLKEKIKDYNKLSASEKTSLNMPYVQTSLLEYELINLQYEIKGTNIKIIEKSGMRKDRYSSLAYNYWVQCQLERELLRKPKSSLTMLDFANGLKKLNQRPNMY